MLWAQWVTCPRVAVQAGRQADSQFRKIAWCRLVQFCPAWNSAGARIFQKIGEGGKRRVNFRS